MKNVKKLLILTAVLVVVLIHTSMCDTQTETFRTTGFAYRYKTDTGWTKWSDRQDSNLRLTIDFNEDMVIIFSKEAQIYRINDVVSYDVDDSGGKELKMPFIDQDGDTGTMRMLIDKDGNTQLWVVFADIMWMYDVVSELSPSPALPV